MAGFHGGRIDSIISFMVNVMMGFPFILLAMSLVAVLGPSLQNIIIALGVTGWPVFTRVARIETMKTAGAASLFWPPPPWPLKPSRILIKHILPNLLPSLLVLGTVEVARAIIRESLLSFLGLGIQPPTPSWGMMLAEGQGLYADAMVAGRLSPASPSSWPPWESTFWAMRLRDLVDPHLEENMRTEIHQPDTRPATVPPGIDASGRPSAQSGRN